MEEVVDLTEDLVKFRTEKGNKEEMEKCLDYIAEYFGEEEFSIRRHERNGQPSMVIGFEDLESPEVMLHGHIDVVDAKRKMYQPEVEDGRIYGRGTSDMKAGLACLMKVMKDFKEEKPSVALMVVTDEEAGGHDGAGYLFSEVYDPSFAISAEPNNMEGYMDIIAQQKGMLRCNISVEGEGAHGSRPWKGENAALKLYEKFEELERKLPEQQGWNTTVNLGILEAGEAINKVPEHAEAKIDVRYTEEYDSSKVLEDLKSIEGLEFDVIMDEPYLKTDAGNEYVQRLKDAGEKVLGDIEITKKEPASDMHFLTEQGVPAVVFGPEGYQVHSKNENAVLESFEDYIGILKQFLTSLKGKNSVKN